MIIDILDEAKDDKFSYSIYYRIEDDVVKVWRVLDNRRDPEWIERQLVP